MRLLFYIVGLLLLLFGASIWRFQLVHWLAKVDGQHVTDPKRVTRLAGGYVMIIGACCLLGAYWLPRLAQQQQLVLLACFIPANLLLLIAYLVRVSRYVK
jgi:uncharacterized membrane protein YesL